MSSYPGRPAVSQACSPPAAVPGREQSCVSGGPQEPEHSSLLWDRVRGDVGCCLLQIPATNIVQLPAEKRETGTWSNAWLLLLKL